MPSNTYNSISKENEEEINSTSRTYSSEHVKLQGTTDIVGHDNQTQIQTHDKDTREGKEKHLHRPRQQKKYWTFT